MFVYINIYIYIYILRHTHTSTYMYTYMYTYIYIYVYTHLFLFLSLSLYIYIYICTHNIHDINTLLLRKPRPCSPAAETALRPLILVLGKLVFQCVLFSGGGFFTDTGMIPPTTPVRLGSICCTRVKQEGTGSVRFASVLYFLKKSSFWFDSFQFCNF